MTKVDISNWGKNFFVKIFAISRSIPNWGKFWQDKDGDSTKIAHHFNIPQWNYPPQWSYLPQWSLFLSQESQGSHSVSVSSPVELWQDKNGDLTKIAFHFKYPQWNYTFEDSCHQELSQEIFPHQRDYKDYILPLKIPVESLSEIYCQEAKTIRVPNRIIIWKPAIFILRSCLPQWCLNYPRF